MDARPDGYGLTWPVHGVLFNYGVALLDNVLLESLVAACAEEGRYEFMFMALPLNVATGDRKHREPSRDVLVRFSRCCRGSPVCLGGESAPAGNHAPNHTPAAHHAGTHAAGESRESDGWDLVPIHSPNQTKAS